MRRHLTSLSAAAIGAVCLIGCANHKPASASYPSRDVIVAADTGRRAPDSRYSAFDQDYRPLGLCGDNCNTPIYPPSRQQGALWQYLFLARDFAVAGDLNAAAQAYWSALVLSSGSVVSRPEKERLRAEALHELAGLAAKRGERRWASLLQLCSDLSAAYLQTEVARKDKDAFYTSIDELRAARQSIEHAQSAAQAQAMMGMMGAMTTQMQGLSASASGNRIEGAQLQQRALMQAVTVTSQQQATNERISEAERAMGPKLQELVSVVAEDMPTIEPGKSLARNAAIFYLSTSENQQAYLRILAGFADGKPELSRALASIGDGPATADGILAVADALLELERLVARYERRGEAIPADLQRRLWIATL